ncbi:MAG: hypothetical protein AB7T06_40605 [Kofleriaceae bacterium]
MSRRKKRTPITVEDESLDDLAPFRKLAALHRAAYAKVHAAACAFIAIYERPHEPDHEFRERLQRINADQEAN